jgi:hypothetical protein
MTAAHGAQGEVRVAGASDALMATVDSMIEGEPFDAATEAQARDAGWRVQRR